MAREKNLSFKLPPDRPMGKNVSVKMLKSYRSFNAGTYATLNAREAAIVIAGNIGVAEVPPISLIRAKAKENAVTK